MLRGKISSRLAREAWGSQGKRDPRGSFFLRFFSDLFFYTAGGGAGKIFQDFFYSLEFSLEQHLWKTPALHTPLPGCLWKGSVQADLNIFLSQFSSTAWEPAPITRAGIKLEGKAPHPKMLAGGFGMRMIFGGQSGNALTGAPPFLRVQSLSTVFFPFACEVLGQGRKAELTDGAGGTRGKGNSCSFTKSCWKNRQRVGTAAGLPQAGVVGDAQSPDGSLE